MESKSGETNYVGRIANDARNLPGNYSRGEALQSRLLQEAPTSFAKRNIYCSPRIFANKYEVAAQRRSA